MFFAKRKRIERLIFILLILYPFTLNIFFGYFATIFAFILSFFDWDILTPMKFVGLMNYKELINDLIDGFKILLTDPSILHLRDPFFNGLKNIVLYTFMVVPIQTILALLLAMMANQKIKGSQFYKVAYFLPATTCPVIVSLIFIWLFMKDGFINYTISPFMQGFRPNWLNDPLYLLPAIALVAIWGTSGHFSVTFLAALQTLPKEVYEAAIIDGASPFQRFVHITLPLLKPIITYVIIMGMIGALQMFDLAWVMAGNGGGPGGAGYTIALDIYNTAFRDIKYGYAAAKSVFLFLLIFSISYYTQKKLKYYRM